MSSGPVRSNHSVGMAGTTSGAHSAIVLTASWAASPSSYSTICHILPLVDDGSKSVDMSLEMLDQAYRDGTEEIILTPHLAYAYGFNNPREKIEELFKEL